MISTLLFGLALINPTAGAVPGEPTIVGPAIAELAMSDDLCAAYGELVAITGSFGDDGAVFIEAAEAYAIVLIEGTDYRFDNEARDAIRNWLRSDCAF